MELKHVIPNMEKTFGNLEFAGENKVEQRRINGRMTVVSRSFNLYSDVQRADDIVLKNKNGQTAGNPQNHNQQPQHKK